MGAGAIARLHAVGWQALPVDLVGYFDLNRETAEHFQQEFGGTVFETLDAFFDAVDIVDICTPAHAHRANVLAAAAAGKAIACEKPLARHVADCEAIIDAVEQAGVPLFVAHVVRFFPQYARAKAVIESGQIGDARMVRTIRAGSFPRSFPNASYYSNFALSGGAILDVAIHDIDFQRWCCGEVERVFAHGRAFAGDLRRDHALITLRFANGAIGHVETGWAHPPGHWRNRIEIAGTAGLVEWDTIDRSAITLLRTESGEPPFVAQSLSPTAPVDNPYYVELAHFLHCLESGEPLRVSPHDALMAVKVSLAAIESVRTGQPVTISDFVENVEEVTA